MERPELTALLETMVARKSSDLFVSVGSPPLIKVEGRFFPLHDSPLDSQKAHQLCYSVLNEDQRKTFEATRELNMSLQIRNLGRFRLNLFRQKSEPALVARHINGRIPNLADLNLPPILEKLVMEDRGLILLVGGTGTGKSSTLASMLDYRNGNREGHILTIEDPVEFVHNHRRSLMSQREVGLDTESYSVALKNAMREAPDVIMIGEVRDMETMKHALAYAETGHLCLSTLHANNANQAIDRILNFFPDTAHAQILQDLSMHLRAVVSQRLAFGTDGKRVPAVEIMLVTPYISELLRTGKLEKLKEAMIQSAEVGCQTLDDALYNLVVEGKITMEEALRHADSRTNLSLRFKLEGAASAAGQASAIKKDVIYAKQVDFRHYRTFRVSCGRFNSPHAAMRQQLETAFRCAMELKGFQYQEDHPDIDLQYAFNAETVRLELQPVMGPDGRMIEDRRKPPVADKLQETLVINMFDMHLDRPVWRVTANAVLGDTGKPQEQFNREINEVLDGFPP